jgi:hypothetical protein
MKIHLCRHVFTTKSWFMFLLYTLFTNNMTTRERKNHRLVHAESKVELSLKFINGMRSEKYRVVVALLERLHDSLNASLAVSVVSFSMFVHCIRNIMFPIGKYYQIPLHLDIWIALQLHYRPLVCIHTYCLISHTMYIGQTTGKIYNNEHFTYER